MANRYEYDREQLGREEEYGRERARQHGDDRWRRGPAGDERGVMDRATDEVRSWFGDDEAARRRQQDERHDTPDEYARRTGSEDYGRRDWTRNRGYDRDYSERDREGLRGRGYYGTERGYAEGEDVDRSSRAYTSPGRSRSEPSRDVDRPDWGWGGSERSQRSWSERDRGGSSQTRQWGTPRDWETSGRDDRWVTGGYSSSLLAWSETGPHTGRGPKGYQRSDDRIREDICDRLTRHGRIDATDIQIQVRSGEVTLDGVVDNREAKRLAEDVAESVDGVREVINHLKTHRGGEFATAARTDKEQK